MALRFQPPPFDERRQLPDIGRGLEAFMNAYTQAKQLGLQEQQAALQRQQAQNQQTTFEQQQAEYRRAQEERDLYERSLLRGRTRAGIPISEQAQAFGYQPMGQYSPVTDTGAVPQQGQGMLSREGESSLLQLKQGLNSLLASRTLPVQEKVADIGLTQAKTDALARGQTFLGANGEIITAPTGTKQLRTDPKDRSMQREIAEAKSQQADASALAQTIIPTLQNLLTLNTNSYGGLMGHATMAAKSAANIGEDDEKYVNTRTIFNTLDATTLDSLKATFPGAISDSERKELGRVFGSNSKASQKDREIAITGLINKINRSLSQKNIKVSSLQGETPAGQPSPASTTEDYLKSLGL